MPGSGKRRGGLRPAQKGVFNARTAKPVTGNGQPPAGADVRFVRSCRCHHAGITPAMRGCQRRCADRLAAGILLGQQQPPRHIRRLIFQMFNAPPRRSLHSQRMV